MDYVSYPLDQGFVGNWLVAGPVASAIASQALPAWEEDTGISGPPVERGPLGTGIFQAGDATGVWTYRACPADHCVDHSGAYSTQHHLRSWAYAELVSATRRATELVLTAYGPAGVWADGAAVLQTRDTGNEPISYGFRIQLEEGVTPVMVRFERLALGPTPHAMSLRVSGAGVHVRLPTLIKDVGRRNAFERLTSGVYVDRDVYAGDTPIVVRWPSGERALCPAHLRLHAADDSIYALADAAGESGDARQLGFAMQLPSGPLRVTLMPTPDEVYLNNVRIFVHVPLWSMGRQRYSALASGDLSTRRAEALVAVAQHTESPFAQIARMALGAWDEVEINALARATEAARRGEAGSDILLVGLLGMLYRWGDQAHFPGELRQPLEDAILGFGYSGARLTEHQSESSRILVQTAEILAGQRYPERAFADGRAGAWHRARGERLALEWMSRLGSQGSADWGAAHAMAHELMALSHLSDLADDTQVYELAAVCIDKLLFTLALNSHHGVLGVACSSAPASSVKSGYLQPTAGLSRMMWGTGIYNHHAAGVLGLACASNYDPPPILEAIARDAPPELWSHERHAAPGEQPADIDTYKTPDYMLSSVRSLTPGSPGRSELVWRVTLSPEAVVFANQPGSSSESDSRLPGYWAGNARLPRVAHWKDVLLAVHRLPADDVFGFTHAYFPCATFDEYALLHGWAFARCGAGYLALANSRGLSLTGEGRYALRELKAWGNAQTWLVHMGRAALDGDFAAFKEQVLALPVALGHESVSCTTLRGDALTVSWSGPLTVNGRLQDTSGAKHFDNAYTTTDLLAAQMEIRHRQDYLRLDFTAPERPRE